MSGLTLSHYTAEPLVFDPHRVYEQKRPEFKPCGLWLSVDGPDDWPEWCRAEEFGLDRLAHRTEFRIRDDANILRLSTYDEIRALADQYPTRRSYMDGYVDWEPIIATYDGVLVAPYVWEARYDVSWYYPWDCASGCFWNLDAVEPVLVGVAS